MLIVGVGKIGGEDEDDADDQEEDDEKGSVRGVETVG
jgi:hypothetical protein